MSALRTVARGARRAGRRLWQDRWLRRMGLYGLIHRTHNFGGVTWLGQPIWQNPLDAWAVQETIVEDQVDLVIECGTNRGGSAYYMASLFDLLGRGHVITIDVQVMTDLHHPRIDFVTGSSVDPDILESVRARADELNATCIMVLLDSDHAGPHVLRELQLYSEFVAVGGHILAQDGCIDELRIMRADRPGPLWAIRRFVKEDPHFEIDVERSQRYLFSHSPSGWLRRVS
ncbi:MAG: CmcI family methyltransferase [Acidimicrobiales bacterium]